MNESLKAAGAAASGKVIVEYNVPARMRDGIVLNANVFRPEGDGPWPVLLARVPYSKDSAMRARTVLIPLNGRRGCRAPMAGW